MLQHCNVEMSIDTSRNMRSLLGAITVQMLLLQMQFNTSDASQARCQMAVQYKVLGEPL